MSHLALLPQPEAAHSDGTWERIKDRALELVQDRVDWVKYRSPIFVTTQKRLSAREKAAFDLGREVGRGERR